MGTNARSSAVLLSVDLLGGSGDLNGPRVLSQLLSSHLKPAPHRKRPVIGHIGSPVCLRAIGFEPALNARQTSPDTPLLSCSKHPRISERVPCTLDRSSSFAKLAAVPPARVLSMRITHPRHISEDAGAVSTGISALPLEVNALVLCIYACFNVAMGTFAWPMGCVMLSMPGCGVHADPGCPHLNVSQVCLQLGG